MTVMPFVFHGCLAVRELVGPEAWDARALLEGVGQASDEMLFTHTAGTMLRRRSTICLKEGSSVNVSALAFIIRLPMEGSGGPRRDQSPMHEPALVAAFVTDNDGNVG